MKISILGSGKSGVAAATLARKHGYSVFVSDMNFANEKLSDSLKNEGIITEFGLHSDLVLDADTVVLSPGIPRNSDIVKKCLEHKLSVISEIEFAYLHSKQPMIGITGSNGKTTTTFLLGSMLEEKYGGQRTGGNIGTALSGIIDGNDSYPVAVELSSFQLESSDKLKLKTAVLLNISPNHLDWYSNMNEYISAKLRILNNANEHSELIINLDDDILMKQTKSFVGKKYTFSIKANADAMLKDQKLYLFNEILCEVNELSLQGPHHLMNMLAASLAAKLNGVDIDIIRKKILAFNGIEHRMELCDSVHGILFYNDSKSTTIESLKMALQSFNKKIILLAGGKHKGASYAVLKDLVTDRCQTVFLYGDSAKIMETDLDNSDIIHVVKNNG
jgi:UDP-N-acetylmuramoylalanine--D-glutamate ligase